MAEVSGLRSRNHIEPNCKTRALDEGKLFLIVCRGFMKVTQQGDEALKDIISVFASIVFVGVSGKLSLSVSQTLLFSVGTRGVLPNVAPTPEYPPFLRK